MNNLYNTYKVAGVNVHDITCKDMESLVTSSVKGEKPIVVFSMNGEGISYYHTDSHFGCLIDKADIVHADGWSTMMAGRLLTKGSYIERVATTDAYKNMLDSAIISSAPVFFLGAKEKVVAKAVDNISNSFPNIHIAGFRNGYFNEEDEVSVFNMINSSGAKLIFVALGRPKQELMALKIRENCPNVRWIKTCGGLFDFLAGVNPRAPLWMQKNGLEWLFRLINEPKRLLWRYMWTNCYSIYAYLFKR